MKVDKSTRKTTRIPSLRRCNNRGFVELNGHRTYLGPWGSPETQEAYNRHIAQCGGVIFIADGFWSILTGHFRNMADL
jgi:hypothetical protein